MNIRIRRSVAIFVGLGIGFLGSSLSTLALRGGPPSRAPESPPPASSVAVMVTVVPKLPVPGEFELQQNYPNPVGGGTVIRYGLPADCHVELTIYNTLGQKVRSLVNEYQTAGLRIVEWNGEDDRANRIASGVYFYVIRAGGHTAVKKLVVVR
ncbi:MAG: T9SS type A sorting domain-containing protein [Candidatus Zixiibacteriota bacterium]